MAFLVLVGVLVVVDLGLITRRPRSVTTVEALLSFSLWVLSALGFSLLVWYVYEKNWLNLEEALAGAIGPRPNDLDGDHAWVQWVTAYVVELALSLDNIAIAALLLRHFKIPSNLVARTLFWNTIISLVVRLGMILGGAWLLGQYEWIKWVLCGVLVVAMLRTLLGPDEHTDLDRKLLVRAVRRMFRISDQGYSLRLFAVEDGRLSLTPLAVVALVSCIADLTFAVDSVPALFSVTRDPLLAFTASTFALLALRSLYFALAGVLGRFRYLRLSVMFVMLAIAGKMFLVSRDAAYYGAAPTLVTLAIVAGVVALGIGASALRYRLRPHELQRPPAQRPSPLEDLTDAVDISRRNFRKAVILIIGSCIALVGIAVVGPLPGPGGIPIVLLGLTILATEFIWARRLLNRMKEQTRAIAQRADSVAARTSPWLVPPAVVAFGLCVLALMHFFPSRRLLIALVAIGPALAIGYWAFGTLRAAWKARSARSPHPRVDPLRPDPLKRE
ncbi:MAG: hypothetical protein IT438_15355 [Phycisphaerales bacterium]|nr:hypothetical protein [Phycisphaerales bacterium]